MTNNFAKNLKGIRLAKGLTLRKVGRETGIGDETIHGYETGKTYPSLYNLIKLAKFFELSLDKIVFGEVEVTVK